MNRLKALITNLRGLVGECNDCAHTLRDFRHDPGCDRERCRHNLQAISCTGKPGHIY